MHLEKIMPRGEKRHSALWGPRDMEGLLLGRHSKTAPEQRFWMWYVLDDELPRPVRRLRGQHFRTRREAVDALETALLL